MLKKIFIKLFHTFLVFTLFFFILLLLVNVFSAKFLELYLSKLTGVSIKIKKVEHILLPLSFKVSGVTIESSDLKADVKDISVITNIKNFFRGKKRFIGVSAKNINMAVKKNTRGSNRLDLSLINNVIFFNNLNLENISFNQGGRTVFIKKVVLDCKKCFQFNASKILLSADGIKVKLDISVNGEFKGDTLIVKKGIVKGEDVSGVISGKLAKGKYSSTFKLVLGNKFLGFLDKKLKGKIVLDGNVQNSFVNFTFNTDNVSYDKEKVVVKANGKSNFKKCDINIALFKYGDYLFSGVLNTDFKKAFLDFKVLNDLFLYKDKLVKFSVKSGNIHYKFQEKNGKVKLLVLGEEKYSVISNFEWQDNVVKFSNLLIRSGSTQLSGLAETNLKSSFMIAVSGEVKNNPEILKILKFRHFAGVDVRLSVNNSKLFIDGKFSGKEKTTYSNLDIDDYKGSFHYENRIFDFTVFSSIDGGDVKVKGRLLSDGKANYHIDVASLPFQNVLKYFDVATNHRFLIDGAVDIVDEKGKLYASGNVRGDIFQRRMEVSFSYENKQLTFNKLIFARYQFQDVGYLNFDKMKIFLKGRNRFFSYNYKNVKLRGVDFYVIGKLTNPFVKLNTKIDYQNRKFDAKISGKLDRLKINLKGSGAYANLVVQDLEKGKGVVKLNKFKVLFDLGVSAFVDVKFDEKQISLNSKRVIFNYKKNRVIIDDFIGDFIGNKLKIYSAKVSGDYGKDILIESGWIDENGFELSLTKGEFFYKDYINLVAEGKLEVNGDFGGKISVFGGCFGRGRLFLKEVNTSFEITSFNVAFFNEKVRGYFIAKDLDSSLRVSFWSKDFKKPYLYGFSLTGENIFISKSGFMGTININVHKKEANKLINGEIFIIQSIFDYEKVTTSKESSADMKVNFPFDLDLRISSVTPIKLKGKFVDANASVDLKLNLTDKKIQLQGKIRSVESYLMLANEKFFIEDGVLKFQQDKKPYLYAKILGSGRMKDLVIVVSGYLPDYTVEINDFSPDGRDTVFNKTQSKSKNAVSSFFSGSLLKELTAYTEKMLGINRITLEETSVVGSKVKDYFEIGRKFSDRFEVKYLIDTGGEGTNYMVGEYILFDWLRFDVIYSSQEGSGAGITFFADF